MFQCPSVLGNCFLIIITICDLFKKFKSSVELNGKLNFSCGLINKGQNNSFIPPAGPEAAHYWHHQQEGRAAGDGDAGCFQHYHPHPQHLYWRAAS